MKKKYVVLGLCAVASFGVLAGAAANMLSRHALLGSAEEKTYTITLNAETLAGAAGAAGTKVVHTSNGGSLTFNYTGLTIEDGNLVFASGGSILNPRLSEGYRNRITGIKQIVTDGSTYSFTVDYTWGESLDAGTPYYQRRGYVVSNTYKNYAFLGERPNYLKVVATADSTVSSIQIQFTCSGEDETGTDNLVINTATQLEQFKTAVNRGNNFSGQTVELGADIDCTESANPMSPIGNKDELAFAGTFDGKDHTISKYTYSGGDAIALFSRVTNGTVKNLKLSDVNLTASGQRAAGIVARASGATLDNVHVLSGTLTGLKESGGLAGITLGTTLIKNSSNAASVTTTGETVTSSDPKVYNYGTGGLVGLLYSGSLTIQNSTNSGAVETLNTGTGGILGSVRVGTATITGVTNAGTVHSTKEGVGGVLGFAQNAGAASTIAISDSENTGTVTGGGGNGFGGIYGSNVDATSYLLLTIDGCVNRGNITGQAHVGGIAGLPRLMKAGSHIDDCENYGDIKSTSSSGYVGGIVSRARIAISNGRCYSEAKLTNNANTILAKDANANGKGSGTVGGFILSVVDSAGSLTGTNKLINLDGTDYAG